METLLKIIKKLFFPENKIEELQVGSIYHVVLKDGRTFTGSYLGYDEQWRVLMFDLEDSGFFINPENILEVKKVN